MKTKLCKHCSIKFEKPKTESLKNWENRHFYCSKLCKDLSLIGKTPWNKGSVGLQKWTENQHKIMKDRFKGEKSPVWKGGRWRHYGHKIAFQKLKSECNICGLKDLSKLTTHHKDKNIHNNVIENLEILCHKCHYGLHKKGIRASIKTEFKEGNIPHNKKEINMDKVIQLRKEGLSYKEIGRQVGLSRTSITKRLTTIAIA